MRHQKSINGVSGGEMGGRLTDVAETDVFELRN